MKNKSIIVGLCVILLGTFSYAGKGGMPPKKDVSRKGFNKASDIKYNKMQGKLIRKKINFDKASKQVESAQKLLDYTGKGILGINERKLASAKKKFQKAKDKFNKADSELNAIVSSEPIYTEVTSGASGGGLRNSSSLSSSLSSFSSFSSSEPEPDVPPIYVNTRK